MPRCLSPRENPVVSRSDGEEETLPHRPHSSKSYHAGQRPSQAGCVTQDDPYGSCFPIFPSLSARDSQNRLRWSFSFGVEFVFLQKSRRAHRCKQSRRPLHARDGRNVLTPSNEGRPERRVSVSRPRSRRRSSDFPADQTSGRERRFPFYARALHPRRCGHERGRCLDLRALDPVEAHSSKPCVRSLKLVALCGPGRWQKTARGRGASGLCWVGI